MPLVVTYHPAYLLRNLPDKAKAWEDLLFARRTLRAHAAAPAPQGLTLPQAADTRERAFVASRLRSERAGPIVAVVADPASSPCPEEP